MHLEFQISPLIQVQVFQARDEIKGGSPELCEGSNQWNLFMALPIDKFVYKDRSQRDSFRMWSESGML